MLNYSISPLLLYLFFFFFQDSKSEGDSKARKVLGHTFTKEEERGKKLSCDKCGKTIWMWQSLFTCNGTDWSIIRHFKNKNGNGAEIRPTIVSVIVTWDAPVSYWHNLVPRALFPPHLQSQGEAPWGRGCYWHFSPVPSNSPRTLCES